ncbi:MAG: hypothetical protein CVT77_05365 [Alphaproteobacteria bacterium HGW-Alphaproteobacteria-16]|nr:MAG: hypothetical protein CVT77_05365 [Alphaproteobacteria bacterium HGW-Alphaproteobacteria-16]
MVLAITGLLLAVVGLVFTYTAHPVILERIRRNPSSMLSRASSLLFLGGEPRVVPDEMSLYDVIYNPIMNTTMYSNLSDERKTYIADYLGIAKNWKFILTEEFKLDLIKYSVRYDEILISLILEFSSHNYFISKRAPTPEREMAIRLGYFITASLKRDNDERYFVSIYLKHICKIENEVSDIEAWSECRNMYFICKTLPYRHVFGTSPGELMTKGDAKMLFQRIGELESVVNRYLVSAVDLSRAARVKFSGLAQKMTATVGQLDDLLKNEEYSELCVRAEMSLSYAHKIIFGNSAISDNAVVNDEVYRRIDMIWNSTSARMRGAATRPAFSISSSKPYF